MTEHSMCQPGRPLPHGESHSGSPTLEAFHRAKSFGVFFSPPAARDPSLSAISASVVSPVKGTSLR